MKIAVIDHIANPGGGSRVVRSLLAAMKKVRPDIEMTLFGNSYGIKREALQEIAKGCDIQIEPLRAMRLNGKDLFHIKGSRNLIRVLQHKYARYLRPLPVSLSGQLEKELQKKIKGFDLAFFPWPFHLKCPDLDCPMVGIFHDFNFRYVFAGQILLPQVRDLLMEQTPLLLEKMTPVVSTTYMKTEVEKFYPQFAHKVRVIPIAPMSHLSSIDATMIEAVKKKFHLPGQYLLAPTQAVVHKNVGPLMAALSLLHKKGHTLPLVFVGNGTEFYNGRACSEGIEHGIGPQNVFGLGYVTHEEIDALIQGATMVVNSSLYEGGNGPGFDAWFQGTPVAMSNIPPFLEHMLHHDVRAAVFDPRSPTSIAEAIDSWLIDPKRMELDALYSQDAIRRFTWEKTAEEYLHIFDEVS